MSTVSAPLAQAESVIIRAAQAGDVPQILALIRELAEYEKLSHEVTATEALLAEHLFGHAPRAEALIAEVDGNIAGFRLFFHNFSTFLGKSGIYIEDIFVRPAFRSQGIGMRFFQQLGAIAQERGCGRIEWWVLDWNQPAIVFYTKRLGAKAMEEWTMYRLEEQIFSSSSYITAL